MYDVSSLYHGVLQLWIAQFLCCSLKCRHWRIYSSRVTSCCHYSADTCVYSNYKIYKQCIRSNSSVSVVFSPSCDHGGWLFPSGCVYLLLHCCFMLSIKEHHHQVNSTGVTVEVVDVVEMGIAVAVYMSMLVG